MADRDLTLDGSRARTAAEPGRAAGAQRNSVLALQRMAGNRATALLARDPASPTSLKMRQPAAPAQPKQPAAKPAASAKVADVQPVKGSRNAMWVTMTDGTRYVVQRQPMPVWGPDAWSFGVDADKTDVWMYLAYCNRGHGKVEVGANVPEAAKDYAEGIVDAIRNGGARKDVVDAIKNPRGEAWAKVAIGESEKWQLTGEARVLAGREGIEQVTGTASLDFGEWVISLDAKRTDIQGNPNNEVFLNVTYRRGGKAPKKECKWEVIRVDMDYTCQRLLPPPKGKADPEPPVPDKQQPKLEARPVFFDYRQSKVDGGVLDNAGTLAEIQGLLDRGFRLHSVTGHTSPEGPEGRAERFEGNKDLSQARADKAFEWVKDRCKDPKCTAGVKPAGKGELFGRGEPGGPELRGKALEQHVNVNFGSDPYASRLSEERLRKLTASKHASERYKYLRRAELVFIRDPEPKVPKVADINKQVEDWYEKQPKWEDIGACPKAVEDAAKARWKVLDELEKAAAKKRAAPR